MAPCNDPAPPSMVPPGQPARPFLMLKASQSRVVNLKQLLFFQRMATLSAVKATNVFTSSLPPDPDIPTPEAANQNEKLTRTPRQVRGALFTYVKPRATTKPELLSTSKSCFETLGISPEEATTDGFLELVSGSSSFPGIHPWAQCYGGYQFGQWAGQLGDGRAISLAEIQGEGKDRFELQLKGSGMTPYSRFADGNAVLRSSIREYLVSEYLHALGIPTTRALALTLLPGQNALRERLEPCAIVARAAQSWIRIGTFDLLRRRGDRKTMKQLADYCINHVFGGEDHLCAHDEMSNRSTGNRYERLYREIVFRNASLVGKMQAYGFMNGVLNTDNTSIYGLSMDYGPFAFMDIFDSSYTPNHDE